jgi:hypothetical protein
VAKAVMFMQSNNLETIEDLRGKVADYYGEHQTMSDKLTPFDRRIKTLDEHLRHSENSVFLAHPECQADILAYIPNSIPNQ